MDRRDFIKAVPLGFFTKDRLKSKPPPPLVARCGACGLFKGCQSPKMKPYGEGHRRVLLLGEAPGKDEDEQGRPFVGKAGQRLRRVLRKIGVDADRDCWITNSLICRPKNNATPTDKQVLYCRPNLTDTLRELEPEVIVPLGGTAVKSLIGSLWKEDVGPIYRWVGWRIPCRKLNCWICPTWHPSRITQAGDDPILEMYFEHHLERAFECRDRPWGEAAPDYKALCNRVYDLDRAAQLVRMLTERGKPVAFDFECDSLKPEREDLDIICCSLSDGNLTFSFPWHGPVILAMKEFLRSDCPKLAHNAKYEHRWVHRKLGIEVNNWVWDGMVAAHVLDNRAGITSLKFQSWVLLGMGPYDEKVREYMKGKKDGGNEKNRLREVDLGTLLQYNALDSLLEYKVARIQAEQLGMKLA